MIKKSKVSLVRYGHGRTDNAARSMTDITEYFRRLSMDACEDACEWIRYRWVLCVDGCMHGCFFHVSDMPLPEPNNIKLERYRNEDLVKPDNKEVKGEFL